MLQTSLDRVNIMRAFIRGSFEVKTNFDRDRKAVCN